MFVIDEKIDPARIKQFASRLSEIPVGLLNQFEGNFNNNQDMNFYSGLLAGLANAYVIASAQEKEIPDEQKAASIGALVAFVASKLEDKLNGLEQ